jgi:hypothetical protein
MLLKYKQEFIQYAAIFLNDGKYIPIEENIGEKIILIKLSNRKKTAQNVTFVNVLYRDKVGWVNENHVEQI